MQTAAAMAATGLSRSKEDPLAKAPLYGCAAAARKPFRVGTSISCSLNHPAFLPRVENADESSETYFTATTVISPSPPPPPLFGRGWWWNGVEAGAIDLRMFCSSSCAISELKKGEVWPGLGFRVAESCCRHGTVIVDTPMHRGGCLGGLDRFVGLVVKASATRVENPGFDYRL